MELPKLLPSTCFQHRTTLSETCKDRNHCREDKARKIFCISRKQITEKLEENVAREDASKSRGRHKAIYTESILGGETSDDEMDIEEEAHDSDESEGSVKTSVEDNVAGSQQVDQFIGCRVLRDHIDIETNESSSAESYEYLVKWAGKSHIHNSWVPESELRILARRKLDN